MSTGLIITTAVVKALQPQLQQHQEPPAGLAAAFMPQPSRAAITPSPCWHGTRLHGGGGGSNLEPPFLFLVSGTSISKLLAIDQAGMPRAGQDRTPRPSLGLTARPPGTNTQLLRLYSPDNSTRLLAASPSHHCLLWEAGLHPQA